MKFSTQNKGFTLIELLVVISIIALLSSVILSSLNSARSKARDAQRRVMAKQFQNALEFYRNENGSYPISGTPGGGVTCNTPTTAWNASANATCWAYLFSLGNPTLSSFLPSFTDPKQTTGTGGPAASGPPPEYGFAYFSNSWVAEGCVAGQFYVFIYRLENPAPAAPTATYCGTTLVSSNPAIVVVKSLQ